MKREFIYRREVRIVISSTAMQGKATPGPIKRLPGTAGDEIPSGSANKQAILRYSVRNEREATPGPIKRLPGTAGDVIPSGSANKKVANRIRDK